MKKPLVIIAFIAVSAVLTGCSGDLMYKEPSIDVLASNAPAVPSDAPVLPAVVLPADFPAVPLLNTEFVAGSLSQGVNATGQQVWGVNVYGVADQMTSIIASYQLAGFLPSMVGSADVAVFDGEAFSVAVAGSAPDGGRFQFAYLITVK